MLFFPLFKFQMVRHHRLQPARSLSRLRNEKTARLADRRKRSHLLLAVARQLGRRTRNYPSVSLRGWLEVETVGTHP
jgi:hypothetical protein